MLSFFTNEFWDGSAFNAPKTASNNGEIMFSASNAMETQDADFGYQKHGLTQHMSLPSSTKMSGMEKLYQVQKRLCHSPKKHCREVMVTVADAVKNRDIDAANVLTIGRDMVAKITKTTILWPYCHICHYDRNLEPSLVMIPQR
ncbi:hypothetical protein Lal_00029101, partial [Lupinus albus]